MSSFNGTDTDNRTKIAPMFRRHLRPSQGTPDLMQRLPPELRNRIYHMVLPSPGQYALLGGEPPLLSAAPWIRKEAAPIYYGNMTVYVRCRLDPPTLGVAIRPITGIVGDCGTQPFKKGFLILIGGAVWQNLANILPLLEIMRATGFEPASKEYRPRAREAYMQYNGTEKSRVPLGTDSMFLISNSSHGQVEQVLEKAVTLGRKARDEKWTQDQLATEFATFVKRKGKDSKP
ncbi:hypothetical protein LTR08_008438 [Meristemomyces frigidus]|nr:hypothetical protein LTR08_008438 [Meristemomyces frigidus]